MADEYLTADDGTPILTDADGLEILLDTGDYQLPDALKPEYKEILTELIDIMLQKSAKG